MRIAVDHNVHAQLARAREKFIADAGAKGAKLAVLNIPLLYETGLDALVDAVVVVSAPQAMQRARVLARPGMTEEKLVQFAARQLPDAQKRARADFVVETGKGFDHAFAEVRKIMDILQARAAARQGGK